MILMMQGIKAIDHDPPLRPLYRFVNCPVSHNLFRRSAEENSISEIKADVFSEIRFLRVLRLSRNRLSSVPEALTYTTRLQALSVKSLRYEAVLFLGLSPARTLSNDDKSSWLTSGYRYSYRGRAQVWSASNQPSASFHGPSVVRQRISPL
ncbi:unnamed protein product [Pieris macdunnoughi]|uniref:Uncharacterized protein n=1 Tax=Pieris macdunnoughi TaxID=345717 RepID=A0A821VMZ7_9NEOP|nr:unnamed protein product [Pieris macdunnoughi]